MEVGKEFNDIFGYNAEMAKVMEDKMFFKDLIPEHPDVIVDFGCADGTMIENLYKRGFGHNQSTYIGYDISESMIELARSKFPFAPEHGSVIFTNSWNTVDEYVKTRGNTSVLILSSVIHEVYSYCTNDKVQEFWDRVLNTGFTYVVIRDMAYSVDIYRETSKWNLERVMSDKLFGKKSVLLKQFEERWGSIEHNQNFVHYMLKHKWLVNWNREVAENYLSVSVYELLLKFRNTGMYEPLYMQRFRPLQDAVYERFNQVCMDDYTHIKLIMKRNIVA